MIKGVEIIPIKTYVDQRGLFAEMCRQDNLLSDIIPHIQMATFSWTRPGVSRGPHEHKHQKDCFFFIGPSDFEIYLWDNRKDSPTYGNRIVETAGKSKMTAVIVPPGVVHGYKNIGDIDGLSIDFPDKLYRGADKKDEPDEIKHEMNKNTPFIMD